jgi:multisubunit Na+/H+ antiporter MnhB subunit
MATNRFDGTRMRHQPALTSSQGTTWLVIATITAVLLTVMFLLLASTGDGALPVAGITATAALLLAMLITRIVVSRGRARLLTLASLYGAMLVVALALTLGIAVVGSA